MKKFLLTISLSIVIINLFACFNKIEQPNIDNNIDNNNINNYIKENISQETYETIISNTVQYGISDNNDKQENKENRKFETIVNCQDCFHNVGFAEKICEQNGKYFFERNKNEKDINVLFDWYVYIFDERQRYKDIKENNQPILTNEGDIDIKKGQYIYILCSYNPDTEVLPSNSDQTYTYYMK